MTVAQKFPNHQPYFPSVSLKQQTAVRELCREKSTLELQDVQDLSKGDIAVLRIPKYYPRELCQKYAPKISEDKRLSSYRNAGAEQIHRTSISYFETCESPELHEQYYRQALSDIRQLRNKFSPNLCPIDQLRLELEEIWSGGATLENVDGKTMNVGLSRVLRNGAEILPHLDVLHWDTKSLRAYELKTQLAANVFLETAQGGELELWCRKLSKQEYESSRAFQSYGLDRRLIGTPDLIIKPEVGDLILFESTHIHAVTRVEAGVRVTMSCFIGYRSTSQPLTYWS